MDRGAVAIIDALGFKGIWGDPKKPSMAVLETLKSVGRAANADAIQASKYIEKKALPGEVARVIKAPFIKIVQLSDTIVVAAGRRPRKRQPWRRHREKMQALGLTMSELEDAVDAWLRYVVCRCVANVLKTAALCHPSLVYRGVVSVGSFAIDETFILGPAVDEAAELMDLADGPFVWLSPSAGRLKHVIREAKDDMWDEMTVRYPVPLKGGRVLPSSVLNPFCLCSPEERQLAKRNSLKSMTSSRIDVAVKRHHAQALYSRIEDRIRYRELRAKANEKPA